MNVVCQASSSSRGLQSAFSEWISLVCKARCCLAAWDYPASEVKWSRPMRVYPIIKSQLKHDREPSLRIHPRIVSSHDETHQHQHWRPRDIPWQEYTAIRYSFPYVGRWGGVLFRHGQTTLQKLERVRQDRRGLQISICRGLPVCLGRHLLYRQDQQRRTERSDQFHVPLVSVLRPVLCFPLRSPRQYQSRHWPAQVSLVHPRLDTAGAHRPEEPGFLRRNLEPLRLKGQFSEAGIEHHGN